MKKYIKFLCAVVCAVLLLGTLSACGYEMRMTQKIRGTDAFFGTVSELVVYDDFTVTANYTKFEKAWDEIYALLGEIDAQLSVSIPTSDIARSNAAGTGEDVSVGSHTLAVMKTAKAVHARFPDYDPSAYPLVDLWAFTPRFNSNEYIPTMPYDRERGTKGFALPDTEYVEAFAGLADFSAIIFDEQNSTLTKTKSVQIGGQTYTQQLDFGGIAKGYAAECVKKILVKYGYKYGFFSCGTSSLVVLGRFGGTEGVGLKDAWALKVENPRFDLNDADSKYRYIEIYCKNVAVSTSGDYQHSYFVDGMRVSHIIDPATGRPTATSGERFGIASVTLLGDDAAELDAMSTAVSLMSVEEILALVNGDGFDGYVLAVFWDKDSNYYEFVTNMPDSMFKVLDGKFVQSSRMEKGKMVYTGEFFG